MTATEPSEFWEARYAGQPQVWSGRVNRVFAEVVGQFAPGRALDLGCGEGVLLAALLGDPRFSEVVGIDPSPRELARAERREKSA